MISTFGLVFLGGAVGGAARFWISTSVDRITGAGFPTGTLVVNVSGALILGGLAAFLLTSGDASRAGSDAWALLSVGVLGSYTTVSSFSLQTLSLLRAGQVSRAALNVVLSFVLCLAGAALGFAMVRWFL